MKNRDLEAAVKNATDDSLIVSIKKCLDRAKTLDSMIERDPNFAAMYRKDKRGVMALHKAMTTELKSRGEASNG